MPTPTVLTQSCGQALTKLRTSTQALIRMRGTRTFFTVTLPLENAMADANDALAIDRFALNVALDPAVRDASVQCDTDANNAIASIEAQPELYEALAAAAKSNTAHNPMDQKLTDEWLTILRRAGAGVDARHRHEFMTLERELNDLQARFNRNLADDASTVTIGRRQLGGIPSDLLATYTRRRDGSCIVPVNEGTLAFLNYSNDEGARQTYWMAYENRAAASNVPIFERTLAVRDRLAHLLGYETWADYRLADTMAGSPMRVEKFLTSAIDALHAPTAAAMAAMRAANNGTLQPWDVRHAEYLVNRDRASVDENTIRQYFPVQHTIDGVLAIYHTMLGVDFLQIDNPDAWSPDVLAYQVRDTASGTLLGTTYFDLYPRPGKFGHFASFTLYPARGVGIKRRPPVAVIVGNWPRPAPGEPALLTHDDVVTFFHEFGHDLAALLATPPYETLSDGFRNDFIEAPSQMLENFAWQPSVLAQITSNWKTGEPMPMDLIDKLVASRGTTNAYETTRLLVISTVDMQYHTSGSTIDTTALWAKTTSSLLPTLYAPGTHPQVAFGHLMSGYDAGLYGYPWSRVYAQDLFTAFAATPLDPSIGMRYREAILAPARSEEPDSEVANFLGRPMSPTAFFSEFMP